MASDTHAKFVLLAHSVRKGLGETTKYLDADAQTSAGPTLLSVDHAGVWHLLVPLQDDENVLPYRGRSLVLEEGRMPDGGRAADLYVTRPELGSHFERMVDEALASIRARTHASGYDVLEGSLDSWRELLRAQAHLSREAELGVFGELVVLRMLAVGGRLTELLAAWVGPEGDARDFRNKGRAMEVKTTVDGHSVTISSLAQLDPSGLASLALVRVVVEEDPSGTTISELVEAVCELGVQATTIARKLEEFGDLSSSSTKAKVESVDVFIVDEEFPGLRSSDLPASRTDRVASLQYELVLAGLRYEQATSHRLAALLFGER